MRLMGNLEHALSMLKSGQEAIPVQQTSKRPIQQVSPGRVLAPGGVVYSKTSLPSHSYRLAQSNTIFTQPQFYSPLHTPQNWQIPSKRREISQWARFFTENEPKVAAAIDFYCFEPSMQVLMADGGQKSISSVEVGDMIRSHDGSVNKVINKFERHTSEKMLKFRVAGISMGTLRCTEGHDMLTQREEKIEFVKAGELRTGDYLLTPANYDDSPYQKNSKYDTDFAWLLGVYAAEGFPIPYDHTDKKGRKRTSHQGVYFVLSYSEKDTLALEIKDKIENIYGSGKISILEYPDKGICRVCVYRKEVADDLCGLCPGMAKFEGSKRFSPLVMRFNNEKLKFCLAGFLSGDGCFNKSNGFQGVGVSKKLSEQIANICDRLGLEYSFTQTRKGEPRQTSYNVRISRRAVDCLKGFTSKIKYDSVDESKIRHIPYFREGNFIFRKIYSVNKYRYTGKVYDLEIENKHSYVVNRVAVHNSKFSMNGFELQCDDPNIRQFYEHFVKKVRLEHWCKMISREYFMIGDVFPFLEIECEACNGTGINGEGEKCRHPYGNFRRIVVLNPDWIDVQTNVLAEDPVITLLPDDELKRIVWHKQPKAIYDRIPANVRNLILSGRPIPLDNNAVSHLKFNPYPYGTYGQSLVRRLFKILAYKDKLMTAQWMVAERLILPVRVVKVGNDERPAGPTEIADVQQQLAQVANDPNLTLVTHHAFDYEWIGTSGKVLQLNNEYEMVNKEILQGLMMNEALLSGEMGGYQSAAIGAEAIKNRMEEWRRELKFWIEEKVFKPLAQMKGFVDEEATKKVGKALGEPVWIYPTIRWNKLHIRDKVQDNQITLQLQERGLISADTTLTELGFDYDEEVEKLRFETAAQSFGQMGAAGGGGGGGLGGLGGGGGGPPPPTGGMGAEMAGGLGGGMELPGGAGAPPSGAAPAGGTAGKIMTKKRSQKVRQPKEEAVQPSRIRLTSLEQKMNQMLHGMNLPFNYLAQYPLGPYRADFAVPALKLALEVDGEKWHNNPEALAKDKRRDAELAYYGWTVARFAEREIKDRLPDVEYTVTTIVNDLWRKAVERHQKHREAQEKAAANESFLIKLSIVEGLMKSALQKKENVAKILSAERGMVGKLVTSMLDPISDEGLRKFAEESQYPYEKTGGEDGEADQGTRDKVD